MGYTETKNMGNKRYLISLSVLMPYAPLREMKCNPQMFPIPVKAEEKQQVLPSYKEGEKSLFSSPMFKKKKKKGKPGEKHMNNCNCSSVLVSLPFSSRS